MLASPFSGSTLNQRSASSRPWIDVIFLPNQAGKVVGISGDEIRLTGAGTNNLVKNASGIVQLTLGTQVAPNTWRYYVTPKPGVALQQTWAQGTVEVSFLATVPGDVNHSPTWCVLPVDAPTTATCAGATEEQKPGAGFGSFTLDPNVIDAAQSNTPRAIGPLTLTNLAVSLVGTTFKDGKLALTIGIGADSAALAFGRTNSTAANANPNQPPPGPNASQTKSGASVTLTGLLGTFDVRVDIVKASAALSNPAALLAAFGVPASSRSTSARSRRSSRTSPRSPAPGCGSPTTRTTTRRRTAARRRRSCA